MVLTGIDFQPHSKGGIVLVVSVSIVCLSVVYLSVNTITPEALEISSQNFQGIIL